MSKKVGAEITCPSCHAKAPMELYRSIWVEYPENRALVLNDQINVFECLECGYREKLSYPFLATNVERNIALWWEPYYDPQIDKDIESYRRHMGPNSFYAQAPRIVEWESFKQRLLEMEAAEPTTDDDVQLSQHMQKAGEDFIRSVRSKNRAASRKKKKWWPF